MNKIKIIAASLLLLASSLSFAVPTWIELSTGAYSKDSARSTAGAASYSAYYCTVEAAETLFGKGKTSASAITTFLSGEDYQDGRDWFEENATQFASSQFGRGQYTFTSYTSGMADDANYIAVVFYNNTAFRAFGTGNAELDSGNVIFDDEVAASKSGTVGAWTLVPEPTSGILLILGIAGLALRRRNK